MGITNALAAIGESVESGGTFVASQTTDIFFAVALTTNNITEIIFRSVGVTHARLAIGKSKRFGSAFGAFIAGNIVVTSAFAATFVATLVP